MRGLVNRLHAVLDIARSAERDWHRNGNDHRALALTLIIRLAERTASPTEVRDDWAKRG